MGGRFFEKLPKEGLQNAFGGSTFAEQKRLATRGEPRP